ncbi:hypothetical protein BC332_24539 [Capsicum chinense]|nr:hypothetical protein BC332_24539 [Capsicum chinense]
MQMQPFKRLIGDEIDSSLCDLYRALLTPVHHQLRYHDNNNLLKRTRSIFSFGGYFSYFILNSELIHFKLLKVLELRHIEIDNFPVQILSLIWLRYLELLFRGEMFDIPPEISRLWNLQTFNVKGSNRSFEVIMGIQNVKELGISRYGNVTDFTGLLNNLVYLQQLETLSVTICCNLLPSSAKAFPATIKKLNLNSTYLSWSYLDIIAEFPNLELLKLIDDACLGEEWHPNVKGFTRLKLLLIEDSHLKYWKATDGNFPILELIRIRSCYYLKEIHIEFADINTLH